jgi:hypothetical protein
LRAALAKLRKEPEKKPSLAEELRPQFEAAADHLEQARKVIFNDSDSSAMKSPGEALVGATRKFNGGIS